MSTQKELHEKFVEITKVQHEQWLQNPITKHMLSLVKAHRELLASTIEAQATSGNITAEEVRYNCVSMKNTKAILTLMENQELFINKLVEQLKQPEQ